MSGAIKHDQGKPRMSLLSPDWLAGVAEVLTFGAKKYAPWNFREGFDWCRVYDSLFRHLNAWASGEDLDPETRKNHLLHASCAIMMLYDNVRLHPERDDRWKPAPKTPVRVCGCGLEWKGCRQHRASGDGLCHCACHVSMHDNFLEQHCTCPQPQARITREDEWPSCMLCNRFLDPKRTPAGTKERPGEYNVPHGDEFVAKCPRGCGTTTWGKGARNPICLGCGHRFGARDS